MQFVGSAVEQLTDISVMQNHSFVVIESFFVRADQTVIVKAFGREVALKISETV
jgi:hypothetical protein